MRKVELKTPPWCPFCGQNVDRPQFNVKRRLGEFAVGTCQCGATYASDPTGFNIGAAMIDALVYACGDNWDLAWDLLPEEDYLSGRIEDYDEQTHQVVATRNLDGRLIKGVLYFIRLQPHVAEITETDPTGGLPATPAAAVEPPRDPKRVRKRADKKQVRIMAESLDIDGLVDLCLDDKRTLHFLQRLLFEPEEAKRWLTAEVIGRVCARVSTLKPGMVSDLLHRLFESCADSAAMNWGAVETIGSILAGRPDIFGAFAKHLLGFLNDEAMRVQVVWACGSIAEQSPEIIRKLPIYHLFHFLGSPDPVLRGYTLRLLGRIRAREVLKNIKELTADTSEVVIYEKGQPVHATVGQLAQQAILLIEKQGEKQGEGIKQTADPDRKGGDSSRGGHNGSGATGL
jgi:hypothetical protein